MNSRTISSGSSEQMRNKNKQGKLSFIICLHRRQIKKVSVVALEALYQTDQDAGNKKFPAKVRSEKIPGSLLPLAAASHGKDLGDPDEDVDGVGVDPDGAVDGVELSGAVERVSLGLVDDLLGVVEQEAAKEDQTSVQGQRVDTSAKSSSLKE